MHVFYLHGFASSPQSTKARIMAKRLAVHGLALHCPNLNAPDFSTLTITRMIDQVESTLQELPPAPVVLIGSSLGGLVAVHVAARHRRGSTHPVEQMMLLAPAFEFRRGLLRRLGREGIAHWRATDRLDVFHYGYGEIRLVGFALYADARQYDAFAARLDVPILIFQGRLDESVNPRMVERFARTRPNVTLRLLDDDHQLVGSMEVIWRGIAETLGIATRAGNPASRP